MSGGLIGNRKVTTSGDAKGIWNLSEQYLNITAKIWPSDKYPTQTLSHKAIGSAFNNSNNGTDLRQIAVLPDGLTAIVTDRVDSYGGVNGGRFYKVNLSDMTYKTFGYPAAAINSNPSYLAGDLNDVKVNPVTNEVCMVSGQYATYFNPTTEVITAQNLYGWPQYWTGSIAFAWNTNGINGWIIKSNAYFSLSKTTGLGVGAAMTGLNDIAIRPDGVKGYVVTAGNQSITTFQLSYPYPAGQTTINIGSPPWSPNFSQGYLEYPKKIVFHPTLEKAYLMTDYSLQVINTATETVTKTLFKYYDNQTVTSSNYYLLGNFTNIAINNNGTKVYLTAYDNCVCVFDTATETWENDILIYPAEGRGSYATQPYGIAVSPDRSKLYVTNRLKNTITTIG